MGEGWVSVLLEDSIRFERTKKLNPWGGSFEQGEMAWLEADKMKSKFPALHELVVNLHALAFELNLKDPSLKLNRPFRGKFLV